MLCEELEDWEETGPNGMCNSKPALHDVWAAEGGRTDEPLHFCVETEWLSTSSVVFSFTDLLTF
jgi:hypothetical protein